MTSQNLLWRYATKSFDPTKKVSNDDIQDLKDTLRYSPSSYGLQPWHFIVVTDDALKQQLKPHSWDQDQITSCSHLFVLCRKTEMDEKYIEDFAQAIASAREVDISEIDGYKQMMMSGVMGKPEEERNAWMARQLYIALGFLMHRCMDKKIDCCPMEGFDAAKYDEILGLAEKGYTTVVACPVGYRSADDKYADSAKVRFAESEVFDER